jgi:hypothetical protein
MEVSGHLHTQISLLPGKEFSVWKEYESGWDPEPIYVLEKRKFLVPTGYEMNPPSVLSENYFNGFYLNCFSSRMCLTVWWWLFQKPK